MEAIRPITGPSVWKGSDYAGSTDWIIHLSPAQRAELERAAEKVRSQGIALDDASKDDFDLPDLAPTLAKAQQDLGEGTGYVFIRGLPVNDYSVDELGVIFWGIGTHLGTCVSQSERGDRLGYVFDRGQTDRYYTQGGPLDFHVDPVDVVGLLCVRAAPEGGASRIVSPFAVHNTMLAECPDLLQTLYEGFYCARRPHRLPPSEWPVPVFAEGENGMEAYLLPQIIYQAEEEGHPLSDQQKRALAMFNEIASRPDHYLDMNFQPGDIQFLNNRRIFHGRTDYRDHPEEEKKRLLLRLWVMMSDWPARPKAMDFIGSADRAGGGVRPAAAQ